MKLLSYADLNSLGIRYSKVHLWRLERDNKFPKRVSLSENRHGWVEEEIQRWLSDKAATRTFGTSAA